MSWATVWAADQHAASSVLRIVLRTYRQMERTPEVLAVDLGD